MPKRRSAKRGRPFLSGEEHGAAGEARPGKPTRGMSRQVMVSQGLVWQASQPTSKAVRHFPGALDCLASL